MRRGGSAQRAVGVSHSVGLPRTAGALCAVAVVLVALAPGCSAPAAADPPEPSAGPRGLSYRGRTTDQVPVVLWLGPDDDARMELGPRRYRGTHRRAGDALCLAWREPAAPRWSCLRERRRAGHRQLVDVDGAVILLVREARRDAAFASHRWTLR